QISSIALLAPGTQWSHNPSDSLPAACEPLTCGIATSVEAAAVVARKRRREIVLLRMGSPSDESMDASLLSFGIRIELTPSRGQSRADRARTTEDGRRMTSVFRYLSSVVRSPLSGALLGGSASRRQVVGRVDQRDVREGLGATIQRPLPAVPNSAAKHAGESK